MDLRRDLATRLIAIRVLRDRLGKAEAALRAQVTEGMVAGDRQSCVVGVGDGGRPGLVGTVGLARPAGSWRVSDPDVFLAWVKAAWPAEVVTTETVRPATQAAVLAACKANGGVPDDNGVLVEVPGVECRVGEPILKVTPNHDAARLVEAAWAAGTLSMAELVEIEAPDE